MKLDIMVLWTRNVGGGTDTPGGDPTKPPRYKRNE